MHYIGVDVGQANDPSAIVVLRQMERFREKAAAPGTMQWDREPTVIEHTYQAVHIEQIPLGTRYQQVARRIETITRHVDIARSYQLVVDMTGVGRPVVEMLRSMTMVPIGVTITGGRNIARQDYGYTVPKLELVTTLQMLFETGRIELPENLEETATLIEQLDHFSYKIKNEQTVTFGNDTERVHDDLVMALALAAWYADKTSGTESVSLHHSAEYEEYDPLRFGL